MAAIFVSRSCGKLLALCRAFSAESATKGGFVYLYYISFTALNAFLIYARTHFYIYELLKLGSIIYYCYFFPFPFAL